MTWCNEFWELYDLYNRLQDDKYIDPKAIERAVVNDPYDSSGSDISTTKLIAPPRIRVLQKRIGKKYGY